MTRQLPLAAEGFGRRYSRRRPWAARDVSFEIPANSITALVGPNGAGKSTLLRACVGFERPDEGRVLVFGEDPARRRAAAVDHVGYVPQSTALHRGLSIADHFDLARAARPAFDRAHARRHIREAGLAERDVVGRLSGGQRAQVALALALGARTELLLLDEPLASLDPLARRDFLTMVVSDVRERGTTAVLSSHIVTDVEQACDRLMILVGGCIALHDDVSAIRDRHRTVDGREATGLPLVGAFRGPGGEWLAVVDTPAPMGRSASLEEIVLAHLASSRLEPGVAA